MRSPSRAVSLFVGCLVVVFAALGWLTWTILRLDRVDEQSRRSAALEENVRLALWRMDSALAPILAQETARPYFTYSAHYPAGRAYDRMFNAVSTSDVLVPSPLLDTAIPHVLLHFQIDPLGSFSSPQVPQRDKTGKERKTPETQEFFERLERVRAAATALLEVLPSTPDVLVAQTVDPEEITDYEFDGQQLVQQELSQSAGKRRQADAVQQRMNANEFNRRNKAYQSAQQQAYGNNPLNQEQYIPEGTVRQVKEGMFAPFWIDGSLFLMRRIEIEGLVYTQGCWLDWKSLDGFLRSQISDLLPAASLEPMRFSTATLAASDAGRVLAALPVRLSPGVLPGPESTTLTPLKISVIVVWFCVLAAATAVALLLRAALVLSERRGAFVSAVTHELRTPLTTFRMYTQMLGDGMVTDAGKRAQYLNVLRIEADRLSHLVENVLAYARLEKGSAGGRAQDLSATELLQRVTERPSERAAQAGVEFIVDTSGNDASRVIHADPAAVEQIVFNLVDNACKYARAAAPRVTIGLDFPARERVAIIVSDNGPGINDADGRKLFQPFSKSARDAAHSAPGVGLGLALSRRLAREMGGDLSLGTAHSGGARFVLTLPAR